MQRRLRPLAVLTTAAAALLSVAACTATPGGGSSTGGSGASTANIASLVQADQKTTIDDVQKSLGDPTVKPDTKLCYVTRTLANEFWGFERDGFESEAQKLGVQYPDLRRERRGVDHRAAGQGAERAQPGLHGPARLAHLRDRPGQRVHLGPGQGCTRHRPQRREEHPAGVVYVGPDAEAIGQSAADYIAQQLPDGGKVAMIEGDPGSSNALNRGKGFKEGLAKHPNLNLVASQTAKWDTNQAQTIATAMLTANPDIKAFYSQNDTMALRRPGRRRREGPHRPGDHRRHRRDSAGEEADRRRRDAPPP